MGRLLPDNLGAISADEQVLKEFRDTLQVILEDIYESLHDPDEGRNFSETEVATGKTWINGKPIYRKVLTLTTASSPTAEDWLETDGSNFSWGTLDVEEVILSFIKAEDSAQNVDIILPFTNGTDVTRYEHDFNNFGFKSKVSGAPTFNDVINVIAIFEFTKTTD